MKTQIKYILTVIVLLFSVKQFAQHQSKLTVGIDIEKKMLTVYQELTYYNQSNDTLTSIVLNDWNNAYSNKNTPLAKRFSDEFVRSFHLAQEKERGSTNNITVIDENKAILNWCRPENFIDLVEIQLKNKLFPNQKIDLILSYSLKIPDDKFTGYGYNSNNEFSLKNCFLNPAMYQNNEFLKYNNLNIDDCANAVSGIELIITIPENYNAISDLVLLKNENSIYQFASKNVLQTNLFIQKKSEFLSYKNSIIEVQSNLQDTKVNDIQKAIIVDKIVNYVADNLGKTTQQKMLVSQLDYEQNPFYGLNQLPSFISPFSDDFIFELKFLKTYLNNYLKSSLQIDSRKDNWIFDAIQIYYMMQYIDEFYPNSKMMGSIAKLKLLKGYNLVSLDFNEQYSYFYMLMARKNLDQPLSNSKETLIKFNEKIASKYRAGLSFKYLEEIIEKENLNKSITSFITFANTKQTSATKFVEITKLNTTKNIDWFFDVIINSRKTIDYKFNTVTKTADSVSFTLTNKTNVVVPIPVYGIKNKKVVFKEWINNVKLDSTYTFARNNADKIVLNYKNEAPEFNQRNNWKSLKGFNITNKPIKFNFMKDLEDPLYNQIIYVPTLLYNFYDGLIPGIRFHNKTILEKPFNFDLNPSYSTNSKTVSGSFALAVNQYNRERKLFNIRYSLSGEYFHYAPDASYQKLNPSVNFKIRENDFRNNHKQSITIRNVYVNREKSQFVTNTFEGNYSVFNIRYNNVNSEVTKTFGYNTDFQLANKFGKIAGEIGFRKLFNDNRQISIRLFAGAFLYNTTNSSYFNFALDRPTDYMFDYNYLGRSENTGIFSQQFIQAEGGFKSKLTNPYSNQYITTANTSFNVWNWIELYADFGIIKSKQQQERYVHDSGIRLNLVPDYFELYFPVYSNNGWETSQPHYAEKIRFIVAFSPKTLASLFTRKWF